MITPLNRQPDATAATPFLVVGVGTAEGGLQSLEDFFKPIQTNGACYLVMGSGNAGELNVLNAVADRVAGIKLVRVQGTVSLTADHIYWLDPGAKIHITESFLEVHPEPDQQELNPVDRLLEQIATAKGANAVGVILSGKGSDGIEGVKSVKKKGGIVIVQNPREASFSEMPRNAIATECVDEILPATEILPRILTIRKKDESITREKQIVVDVESQRKDLDKIFNEIIYNTGHDFTNYKKPTLLRRIERRMVVHQLSDLSSYALFLARHPEEVTSLVNDLLISVTSFFRDAKAFEIIEQEVLPRLLSNKKKEDLLRLWIPGCATGEEAYTLAMLCAEKFSDIKDHVRIQIFATDIDTNAISVAREGLYAANELSNVSSERIRRFFTKEENMFRIRREIRETIMFANHNFLKDPPFSNLDLISCRNVLIYLDRVAKDRVINTFHFALNPGAFLLLGSSESIDPASGLFSTYNRENHVFQSRRTGGRVYTLADPATQPVLNNMGKIEVGKQEGDFVKEAFSFGSLHLQLLEQYAPPSLLINEEYDLIHLSDNAGRYLQMAGGHLSRNILKLVHPDLRLELRSALYQAAQRKTAVEAGGVDVDLGDRRELIDVLVRPVTGRENGASYFLIILGAAANKEQKVERITDEPVAKHLEDELMRLKTHLRFSNEQHEFQAEELKASNEELQAMNEELRSSAEELETNKEELQSINEELRTVNEELKLKVGETRLFANNLQNLINSTDIGTIFLDRGFRVALFTPAARNIFNLIHSDYGRPITDITSRLNYNELLQDAESVMDKLTMVEKEVISTDQYVYLMRLFPYRTADDRINGVVVTFIDITTRKLAEEKLKETIEELTRFNKAMISRETRMIELKKEVNALRARLGEPEIYRHSLEKDADGES